MNADTIRASLVALALAGFVALILVLSRSPEPPPTARAASVAVPAPAAPRTPARRLPRVHAEPEPSLDTVAEGRRAEIVADDPPANPEPVPTAPSPDDKVMAGLKWFKERQSADGGWLDPATTGIVLFAFFGRGETHQSGSSRDAVRNGLKHLRDVQDAEGCLAPRDSMHVLRDHAIAGLALVESYGMTGSRVFKESAQRAVAFAMKTRTPSSGWSRPDGRIDFEATVWMSMLVKSAESSELDAEETALADAVTAIDQVTDHATGRVASPSAEISDEAATAMGMFVRMLAGHVPATDDVIRKGADVLAAKPPALVNGRVTDPAACYFGTVVMHNLLDDAHYTPWAKALVSVLGSAQSTGDTPGQRASWTSSQIDASETDRIRTTAYVLRGMECVAYAYRGVVK